jgi:NTP pyrophosphatase (non-canonical NTP hydrolase)
VEREVNANDYQQRCLRTVKTLSGRDTLALCGFGLAGESGEVLEASVQLSVAASKVTEPLKKFLFHNKELDCSQVALEIGDVLWYAAVLANELGYTLEEVMQMNVDKLQARYGDMK